MDNKKFKTEIGKKELIVEISNWAEQANGSCLIRYGDTEILSTAVMSKYEREGIDFFPLTVEYQEKYYAAGKILGSRYFRREGRPSEEAILTARTIDRTIRPRFPEYLRREVQVILTCLSWDRENDPDIPGLIAASISLSISDIPWHGPITALRIGKINEKFILNPSYEEREKSEFDLVLAGIENPASPADREDDILINMIELEAKEVDETTMLKAIDFAKPYLKKIIDFQKKIKKEIEKEKIEISAPFDKEVEKKAKEFLETKIEKALYRENNLSELKEKLINFIEEKYPREGKIKYALSFFEERVREIIHKNIIEKELRPDGRKLNELREISSQVNLLPRTHGSGLFCRGKTKALSILTLGAPGDVKFLEGMEIIGKKRFMHHYNFPPYSTGEVSFLRGPGRREIGHGMLVEKALTTLIPDFDSFPYAIRIVTEILSSNGSTSMASVSSATLSLMDAGVPIKNPAAGISIGLIMKTDKNYKILTDIQGPEDHYGDMDFKVAGTKQGITAMQMDVKIDGLKKEIIEESLKNAKKARFEILDKMEKLIAKPRKELSPFAPRVYILQIKPEKIREVIGPGGKVIHEIIKGCEVSIDIEDSGKIFITAEKEEAVKKATSWIKNITREIKVGEIFEGKVKKILNFGAFVEILPGQEGLVHISQLSKQRVRKVEDVVKIGDIIPVKVISIDENGRIDLSLKEARER